MTRPIESLLLESTNAWPDSHAIERMRHLINDRADWSELLRLAIPHGVLPLISHNLSAHAADITPIQTLTQLQLYRGRVGVRNRTQANELLRVIHILSQEGIRALPFKGPVLAVAAYGDMSLRESHDLDIWLNAPDLEAAGKALRAAGYRAVGHINGMPRVLLDDRGKYQTEFLNATNDVLLELHDDLQSPQFSFSPEFDEVWNRRTEILLQDVRIPCLCTEDLLLALLVHGSKHLWRRLSWLADIAGLVYLSPSLNWELTLARAKEWRCRRRMLSGLMLAKNLYGLRLPDLCEEEIRRHSYTRSTVTRIERHIATGTDSRTVSNFMSEIKHHTQNADSISDRRRIILSYMDKISKVDETSMLRPMPPATRRLYRLSRAVRALIGGLQV